MSNLSLNVYGTHRICTSPAGFTTSKAFQKAIWRPVGWQDDVLHALRLPSFEETLGPDESEALMSRRAPFSVGFLEVFGPF